MRLKGLFGLECVSKAFSLSQNDEIFEQSLYSWEDKSGGGVPVPEPVPDDPPESLKLKPFNKFRLKLWSSRWSPGWRLDLLVFK